MKMVPHVIEDLTYVFFNADNFMVSRIGRPRQIGSGLLGLKVVFVLARFAERHVVRLAEGYDLLVVSVADQVIADAATYHSGGRSGAD
jgi:hypothetical protein